MDVSYNSIDIRDLLSSTNLDDLSAPLSAPDLHLVNDHIQVHSVRIKSKVQDYLVSHRSEFSSLFSRCFNVATKTGQLSSELVTLLSLLSDGPVDGIIKCTSGEIVGKRKELREKRELFDLLLVVLELCEKLKLLKSDIRNGKVEEAAKALRELKVALRVDDDNESGLVLYQILRKEWHDCFEEMQDTLVMLVQHAIKFEPSDNSVLVKHWLTMNEDEKIELCTVLKGMDEVGALNYGLAKVADLMIKHIVSPAIVCGASVAVMDEISNDDRQNAEEVLKVVSSTRDMVIMT